MSIESVQTFFARHAPDIEVLQFTVSLATVADAAATLGVAPGQIAKTLTCDVEGNAILLVLRGDSRIDNRKFKQRFGVKARMVHPEQVEQTIGHPVGGVCPFGLSRELDVYIDVALRAFPEVFPSGGAPNSAVRLTPARLATLTKAQWVDVGQLFVQPT